MPNLRPRPLTGGYYWYPESSDGLISWHVLTCHDLGSGPDVGHVDLWPAVIERLAASWGRDARSLGRLLSDGYTGLPRGRCTRPGRRYMILHGDDAPVADWQERIVRAFHLEDRAYRFLS